MKKLTSNRRLSSTPERSSALLLAMFCLWSEPEEPSDHRGLGGGVMPWLCDRGVPYRTLSLVSSASSSKLRTISRTELLELMLRSPRAFGLIDVVMGIERLRDVSRDDGGS